MRVRNSQFSLFAVVLLYQKEKNQVRLLLVYKKTNSFVKQDILTKHVPIVNRCCISVHPIYFWSLKSETASNGVQMNSRH